MMKELPINQILCGDCVEVMKELPENSIDLVVTSPPYYGLRDYGVDGQIGLEEHPQLYIDKLVAVAREIRRILKKSGSFYLNLGDTYFTSCRTRDKKSKQSKWLQPKQLMLIPSRVAVALQHDGWILRNDIVWYKPNHMPSSVTDRLTNSWEHVFHFVKSNKPTFYVNHFTGEYTEKKTKQYYVHDLTGEIRYKRPNKDDERDRSWFDDEFMPLFSCAWRGYSYFYDLDAIRELHIWSEKDKRLLLRRVEGKSGKITNGVYATNAVGYNPKGKNLGDCWMINTQPFKGAHFAVFPERLVEPIVKSSCPEWICRKCGKPRVRMVKKGVSLWQKNKNIVAKNYPMKNDNYKRSGHEYWKHKEKYPDKFLGWSDCGCGAGFDGGIVLDPFCGSGTTCVVAHKLGRRWIGIDKNPEYYVLATKRLESVGAFSSRLTKFLSDEGDE